MIRRLRDAALALLVAWMAATLVTLPFPIQASLRNSDGDLHLFKQFLPLVVMVWAVWTGCICLSGWLLSALPIAMFVNPRWIYRRRWWILFTCLLVSLIVPTTYFRGWVLVRELHDPVDKHNYALYTAFTVCYAVTTAGVYAWLCRVHLDALQPSKRI